MTDNSWRHGAATNAYIALVLLVLGWALYDASAPYREDAAGPATMAQPLAAGPPHDPCRKPETLEEIDLCRQWRIAGAADEQARWAFPLFVVAVAGAGALFGVIALVWRATAVAVDANRIARESARVELRAYVHFHNARLVRVDPGHPPRVSVTIRNFGKTPAYNFRLWTVIGFQPYPLPGDIPAPATPIPVSLSTIPPGHDIEAGTSYERPLSAQELQALSQGAVALYVAGRIAYDDAFGEPRDTQYCVYTGGPIGVTEFLAVYDTGNSAT